MPSGSISFDRAADYYDRTRGFPPGEERPIAALICRVGGLMPDSRVLEVGVGTGRIALPLAKHVRMVVGIDLSRPMMERLRAKHSGEAVYPVQGDAVCLPFPASVFDAVVTVHVFHLIPDYAAALTEITRVLRPNAPLINGWSTTDWHSGLGQVFENALPGEKTANVGVQRDSLPTFLSEHGWRSLGGIHTHRYTQMRAPQEYLNGLEQRVWSRTWRLTDEELAQGIAAVREAIRQLYDDPRQEIEVGGTFNVEAYLPPP